MPRRRDQVYCSAACRERVGRRRRQGRVQVARTLPVPDEVRVAPVVVAALARAGRADVPAGAVALKLAVLLDDCDERTASAASIARELMAACREALADTEGAARSLVDELKARRDERRRGA